MFAAIAYTNARCLAKRENQVKNLPLEKQWHKQGEKKGAINHILQILNLQVPAFLKRLWDR